MIEGAIEKYGNLNLLALSSKCEITYTGLWYTVKGMRKWNTELWLKVLCALDAIEVKKDRIIIHTKDAPEIGEMVEQLAAYDYSKEKK